MKKIEVKAWFSDWREVTKEEAREFVSRMMDGILTRSTFEGKAELIDGTHLRGITCKELFADDKKKGENKMKTKKIRMLEVIECWGWVHGSGWSNKSDYDSKIVELTMDDIKHMDWDWIEIDDEYEYDETDVQWRVTYYDLSGVVYDEDEDQDNIGNILSFHADEIEEIACHTVWESELRQQRKDSSLISLPQYAKQHGLNLRSVQRKARFGGFDTARKIGRNWVIDADEPYIDRRYKPKS